MRSAPAAAQGVSRGRVPLSEGARSAWPRSQGSEELELLTLSVQAHPFVDLYRPSSERGGHIGGLQVSVNARGRRCTGPLMMTRNVLA